MSTKTASEMEAILLDKIQKSQAKLEQPQQKHKLEIGTLAYKHSLQNFDIKLLGNTFATIAKELNHEHL